MGSELDAAKTQEIYFYQKTLEANKVNVPGSFDLKGAAMGKMKSMGGLSTSDPRAAIIEEAEKAKMADEIFEKYEVEQAEITAAVAAFGVMSAIDPMQAAKLGLAGAGASGAAEKLEASGKEALDGAKEGCMGQAQACCTIF